MREPVELAGVVVEDGNTATEGGPPEGEGIASEEERGKRPPKGHGCR
jgi:hypothetical protein